MRTLRPAVMAMFVAACPLTVLTTPTFAQTCACAPGGGGGYVIQADEAPPPLPEYNQPPIPGPGYYWTPGYWAWNNYDYYWVPGAWVEPPQPGLLWTPGYWAFIGGVYAFRPGYWGPRVGFYGGIDYGFGYTGDGYYGGRWDNNRFYYNTTVNNISGARITNVYRQPIVANATRSAASFNGGPAGVVAKPTAEQLAAAKEEHVRPTRMQVDQARAAGMRSEQFVTANHGKPAIAATERPGQFKGKGVVPARAAGKAAAVEPARPGAVTPNTREKPAAGEKPGAPGLPANAPKAEEKPSATEKLAKPEAAPAAPKAEEKLPRAEKLAKPEAAPAAPKAEEKRPPAKKLAKPEAAPAGPKAEERRPAAEKMARPEPAAKPAAAEKRPAAEKAMRPEPAQVAPRPPAQMAPRPPAQMAPRPPAQVAPRPPAQAERRPAQPERRPPPNQCGRPGLPPCPK